MTAEKKRLLEEKQKKVPWKKWGPYLSEREWGTVREDYSADGEPWEFFTHDMARSKAYRWGEDGIGGICDNKQNICFALAFWNEKDTILKERLFGLSGKEGNHGEDVKEYYYYPDNTPTHSYMKMCYKYPQAAFPYQQLIYENASRGFEEPEFELVDSGIFDDNKYFDIFVEYAKADAEDLLIKITAVNRAHEKAAINVIPQIWFRNFWSWIPDVKKPRIWHGRGKKLKIDHPKQGSYFLYFERDTEIIFCENETNSRKLYGKDVAGFFKDGINEYLVNDEKNAVNHQSGTKAGLNYRADIEAHASLEIRLRLSKTELRSPFRDFNEIFQSRIKEADEFYAELQADVKDEEERKIQRQAFAGLLWSKQFYHYDVSAWLDGDPGQPAPAERRKSIRNFQWEHLNNADIISMPDKWEYPWYAAWDLAFHCIPLAHVDAEFAKEQLLLLTREWYMHPNGQLPAYEWEFGDVNPPVHAWAAWRVYEIDRDRNHKNERGDLDFLERVLHKLLLNFTWWVNRKDEHGKNLFQGGFLGLDNIGVFNRSEKLPTGGHIEQSDGTAWMAMYSLNLMRISLHLAQFKPVYQDLASKFFEHFLYIAAAMANIGGKGINLWDEQDEFFYDVLHCSEENHASCQIVPLKVRSLVGLIPLFAVEVLDSKLLEKVPEFKARMEWFLKNKPDLANLISRWNEPGVGKTSLLSLLRGHRMKMLLRRMLDETEFLSDFGVRSLSKFHEKNPYVFAANGVEHAVRYVPGESESGLFGGNSNWRGPIWFPVNYLIVESMKKFYQYYGDDFKIECPTGSGKMATIDEAANEIIRRLCRLFFRDKNGRRPVFGDNEKFQTDPRFSDQILFHEYFHGDTGKGIGASHQTGWTGLVADLIF
ncbi:MAG: glucosidase [Calditrichaeota bacterium]|nr:glucosidase [Calditrichota bacterium]